MGSNASANQVVWPRYWSLTSPFVTHLGRETRGIYGGGHCVWSFIHPDNGFVSKSVPASVWLSGTTPPHICLSLGSPWPGFGKRLWNPVCMAGTLAITSSCKVEPNQPTSFVGKLAPPPNLMNGAVPCVREDRNFIFRREFVFTGLQGGGRRMKM